MRHFILAGLFCIAPLSLAAAAAEMTSPDGSIRVELSTNAEAHLLYAVRSSGELRLEPAPLGIIVEGIDLGVVKTIGETKSRTISETFAWRGNKTRATNHCQVYELPVQAAHTNLEWTLEIRVFNDGAGFRCRVPGSGIRRIRGEPTRWKLPKDSIVWLQTNTANYEGVYHSRPATQVPLEVEVKKHKQLTHIGPPMTIAYSDRTFGLISEAALYKYSGLTLRPLGDAEFQATFEDDAEGWTHEGSILSPWRVIVLAKDLNGLVNSDLIAALCDPPDPVLFPDGMETAWLRPGKAPCTWMVYGNDGAQWDRQKWFVDVSAAIGCEYLLVDAGWRSERWGWMKGGNVWERAAELCRYAVERNVGIILWHAYPEGREDSPGLTTVEAREELFKKCHEAGVKGVKIDFFDSESKSVIEAYEDLLHRAAKHRIMVNFHGANKPTGEPRTWPNEMTREGIREQEYVLWGSLTLPHYGALPFTRMAAGHGDFLPGYVQRRFLKNTTAAFQAASTVVFSTPFLCWPDNPEAYLNSPLLQLIRSVPVTWDETRILPGSVIGETVIMARRKGAEWYVAVLNCRAEKRDLEVDLSFADLAEKELTVYRDGAWKAGCQIESAVKPPESGKFAVSIPSGGGALVHVVAPKAFAGWK